MKKIKLSLLVILGMSSSIVSISAFSEPGDTRYFCTIHGGSERALMQNNDRNECIEMIRWGQLRDAYCNYFGSEYILCSKEHDPDPNPLFTGGKESKYVGLKTVHIPEHCATVDPFY